MFDVELWTARLDQLAPQYQHAEPYPHVHLENLLDADVARQLEAEFPSIGSLDWIHYKHYNEDKLGLTKRDQLPENLGRLVDEFNSPAFVAWLSRLTGIPNLLPDPDLEGGGLHQSQQGGFLNIHADFTVHHHHPNWQRRVNLILYLNEGWKPEWQGAIELWDRQMTRSVAKVPPLLNHALIFNTGQDSYHGFPEPLACPEGVSRKSVAMYYYTAEEKVDARSTNYRARPADTQGKAALIWADKQAISVYSKIKSKLGLSDRFASRVLAVVSWFKHRFK